MLGALLVAIGTLSDEIGSSVGKYTIRHRIERPYTIGLASSVAGLAGILAIGLFFPTHFFGPGFPGGFTFALVSLPTLVPRIILEIVQSHVTLLALVRAERSTFAFIRVLTIPLLLLVDVAFGYSMSTYQMVGILCIAAGLLLILFRSHGIARKGAGLTLFTALNAVLTISLYKYDITYFNSVEAEQAIVLFVIVAYFVIMAHYKKERPLAHLLHPAERTQLLSGIIANTTLSFSFLYLQPSVATAGRRGLSGLWALGAGAFYFKEKHIVVKAVTLCLTIGGIVLLTLQ